MLEAARTTLQNLTKDSKVKDWFIRGLPEEDVEYMIINKRCWELEKRAPGKYTTTLNVFLNLSNLNLLTRIYADVVPASGMGLYPAALPIYTWGRWHDDMADGHANLPNGYSDYLDVVEDQKLIIENGGRNVQKGFNIDFLLKRAMTKLAWVQKPGDNIKQDLTIFLDSQLLEYQRRVNKTVSTREELAQLYSNSFGKPHNIMLIAFGSSSRESEVPELAQIQGKMYNSRQRSLEEDLATGICYIPSEVLTVSGLKMDDLVLDPWATRENYVIQDWVEVEKQKSALLYRSLRERTKDLDWKARYYVKALTMELEGVFKSISM